MCVFPRLCVFPMCRNKGKFKMCVFQRLCVFIRVFFILENLCVDFFFYVWNFVTCGIKSKSYVLANGTLNFLLKIIPMKNT